MSDCCLALTQRFSAISWLEQNEHERLSSFTLVVNTNISRFPVFYSQNVLLSKVRIPYFSKSSVSMKRKKNLIYRVISEYTNEYWQHYPYYYINLYNGNNTHQSFLNNPRSKLFSFNAYFYVVIENYRYCDVNVTRR